MQTNVKIASFRPSAPPKTPSLDQSVPQIGEPWRFFPWLDRSKFALQFYSKHLQTSKFSSEDSLLGKRSRGRKKFKSKWLIHHLPLHTPHIEVCKPFQGHGEICCGWLCWVHPPPPGTRITFCSRESQPKASFGITGDPNLCF